MPHDTRHKPALLRSIEEKETPATVATATGGEELLQTLIIGYGILTCSASLRRRKWTVDAFLTVEVVE